MYILQILHQHIFRQYDQLFLNLKTNEELSPDSLAEAIKVKAAVSKDLERIGTAINAPIVGPQPEPENE